jgi:iron complex outermembrane receptor protein
VPTASLDTVFNEQLWREETTDRHTLIDARYGHELRSGTRLTVRASFDRYSYSATYPYIVEPDTTPTLVGDAVGLGSRWSVSSGVTRALRGRQTFRAGVEFIDNIKQNQIGRYLGDAEPVLDSHRSSMQHAIYAQDEIKFGRWVIINAGLRYDHYRSLFELPRARL